VGCIEAKPTRFQIVLARFAAVVILAEGRVAGFFLCRHLCPDWIGGEGNNSRTVGAHTPKASR